MRLHDGEPEEPEELSAELDTRSVDELLVQVMADMESPEPWVETGFPKLDNWLDGGIRPGEVMLIAARPSVGKSAFALQLALHMVSMDVPVTVWSLEMRPKAWVRRGMAGLSGVELGRIRRGEIEGHEKALTFGASMLMKKPLYFAPEFGDTTPEGFPIQAAIEVEERKSKVLLIDYLQLMQPPARSHSREQEVAQLSRSLKMTANRLGVSIIALAQLNRDAQGKVPGMNDLRESGALEQDADEIVFLHRDLDKDTNLYKDTGLLVLGKNRDGQTGGTRIRYDWRRFMFLEA